MQTFETAYTRLEQILQQMSSDDISLEGSLNSYAEAAELIKFCNAELNSAKLKIKDIEEVLKEVSDNDKL